MKHWTPLWSMIVTSSLWGETKDVRLLFVTMMAIKDYKGRVFSTSVGLARIANLTTEECAVALKVLESPDTKSLDIQEFEGRRIERIEGGWFILNHLKYRDMMRKMERNEYQRNWMAEYRKGKKQGPVTGEAIALRAEDRGDTDAYDKMAATPKDKKPKRRSNLPDALN